METRVDSVKIGRKFTHSDRMGKPVTFTRVHVGTHELRQKLGNLIVGIDELSRIEQFAPDTPVQASREDVHGG